MKLPLSSCYFIILINSAFIFLEPLIKHLTTNLQCIHFALLLLLSSWKGDFVNLAFQMSNRDVSWPFVHSLTKNQTSLSLTLKEEGKVCAKKSIWTNLTTFWSYALQCCSVSMKGIKACYICILSTASQRLVCVLSVTCQRGSYNIFCQHPVSFFIIIKSS